MKLLLPVAAGLVVLAAVVPSVAQAAVTQSSITTPADPYYAMWNEQVATPNVTISGTSNGTTGDAVDIRCYHDNGSSGTSQALLASNLTVGANGSFSTTVPLSDLNNAGGGECRLRAVPHSTTPTSGLGAYAGPRSLVSYYALATNDYDIFSRQLGAENEYDSLGGCGIDNSILVDPTTFGATNSGAWGCNDWTDQVSYSNPSQAGIEIDGEPTYAPAGTEEINNAAAGIPPLVINAVSENPANGDLTIDETDALVHCLGYPFPATGGNCSTFVSAGVSVHRIVTETDNGHTITFDDSYSSTDGSSHLVSLRLENDEALASPANTSYEFPGQSSFAPATSAEQVNGTGGVPATILLENTNFSEPSTSAVRAAITYYQAPSGPFTFQTNANPGLFDARNAFTVPATGSVLIRYSYSEDYTLAAVEQEAQAAEDANNPPTVSITSPAPATTVVDSPVVVSGTASAGTGVRSVTVNGVAATLTGTTWSATVALTPGQNTITVTVTSETGVTSTTTETLDYSPPTQTVPPTDPMSPSNDFTVASAQAEPNGTIVVKLTVPAAGTVAMLGTHEDILRAVAASALLYPGHDRFEWARASGTAAAAGTVAITSHPDAAGKRLIARHRRYGWALHVTVWTTYTPVGGFPRSHETVVQVLSASHHH